MYAIRETERQKTSSTLEPGLFNKQENFCKHDCVWDENKSSTTNNSIVKEAGVWLTSKIGLVIIF